MLQKVRAALPNKIFTFLARSVVKYKKELLENSFSGTYSRNATQYWRQFCLYMQYIYSLDPAFNDYYLCHRGLQLLWFVYRITQMVMNGVE